MKQLPFRLGVALACLSLAACQRPEAPAQPPRAIRYIEVSGAAVAGQVDLAGEVRARVESGLGFQVPGRLIERHVSIGEHVRQGQILARLDARDLELGRQAAEARVTSAKAEYERAQADFARFSELAKRNYVSAAELQIRQTSLSGAKATYDQARADADLQTNREGYGVLRADADGTVIGVGADVGEVVNVGQPVIRLARDGVREIEVQFPEDRRALAQAGAASVSLWAAPQQRFPAKLRELSAAADPVTRTFTARYTVTAPVNLLALGQSAELRLALPGKTAGVRLPTAALVEAGGKSQVWAYDDGKGTVRRQAVQVVGVDGNDFLVLGLKPGQKIATAGVHVLQEGQQVRLLAPSRR